MFVIVPNEIRDAINSKLDPQLKKFPQLEKDREEIFNQILGYYDENGSIPDFNIEPK